jgi:hypothetical protein
MSCMFLRKKTLSRESQPFCTNVLIKPLLLLQP